MIGESKNMSDNSEPVGGTLRLELGNAHAVGATNSDPWVALLQIPQGIDQNGNALYSHPEEHDDGLFPQELSETLADVPADKPHIRRALIGAHLSHPSGVKGLPNHEAAVAVIHPNGFWNAVAEPGTLPAWVSCPDHPGLEKFLADYYGCPQGKPEDVEDTYWTFHNNGVYMPGAAPDPLSDIVALHTTYGRVNQALVMGGLGYLGTVGTATATSTTTLAGSAETGVTHTLNDCAGQWLVVGPNVSGTGSKVYGLILSNTTGTTPTYTVDQWYNAAAPGGAVGTQPNATGFYQVVNGGPSSVFVALSSNTTAKSLLGTAGSADAPLISTALTSEFTQAGVSGTGLSRKIAPIGTSALGNWTATPVFTATAADQSAGAQTVGTAALTPSMVATAGVLNYMTLVSPTATLTATGDQLTLTWTFTMT